MPDSFTPYDANEVATIRHDAMLNQPEVRAQLIEQMREQGIAIEDGMY